MRKSRLRGTELRPFRGRCAQCRKFRVAGSERVALGTSGGRVAGTASMAFDGGAPRPPGERDFRGQYGESAKRIEQQALGFGLA